MKVFESPSFQDHNIGWGNYGSEEYECNRIMDAVHPILVAAGFQTARNDPYEDLYGVIAQSNAYCGKTDIHLSVHTNACESHQARGCTVFYYTGSAGGLKLANAIYNRLSPLTPTEDRKVNANNAYLELKNTDAIAVIVEVAFHDNPADAQWIMDNIQAIGQAIAGGVCDYAGVGISQPTPKHPIMGATGVTAAQMVAFLVANNTVPSINMDYLGFAQAYLDEGAAEGVRGDIAFCQSIKETGWFKFGGQVLPEQNNYAGIGATNNSPTGKGAWFNSPREGIRAQIQHLKSYASTEALRNSCIDPRFNLVARGSAPNWEDLNGHWAVPGDNYGQDIIALYDKLVQTVAIPVDTVDYKKLYNDAVVQLNQYKSVIDKIKTDIQGV